MQLNEEFWGTYIHLKSNIIIFVTDDIETTPLTSKHTKSSCSMTPLSTRSGTQLPKTLTNLHSSSLNGSQPMQGPKSQLLPTANYHQTVESDPLEVSAGPTKADNSCNETSSTTNENGFIQMKDQLLSKDIKNASSVFPIPGIILYYFYFNDNLTQVAIEILSYVSAFIRLGSHLYIFSSNTIDPFNNSFIPEFQKSLKYCNEILKIPFF